VPEVTLTGASRLLARASAWAYVRIVNDPKELPRDIGTFIRDLRRNARISLRQLAEQAGVSNPYLSQIERGLRKPSAEVLSQLAGALRVSTPLMYLRAGLLDAREGQGVLAAIAADAELTVAQKQSLIQIYETFRRENARAAADANPTGQAVTETEPPAEPPPKAEPPAEAEPPTGTEPHKRPARKTTATRHTDESEHRGDAHP
jgi:transcriptional regulator with XRE-family HTH domain